MTRLIMMVGVPGSGKSRMAKWISETNNNIKIFSSDEYRKKLLGNENDQTNNNLIFETLYIDIAQSLVNGESCIFDATNICYKDRKRAFDSIDSIINKVYHVKLSYKKEAIVCCTSISNCIYFDKNRERTVGEYVINKFVSRFEYPQYFEGFSSIESSIMIVIMCYMNILMTAKTIGLTMMILVIGLLRNIVKCVPSI